MKRNDEELKNVNGGATNHGESKFYCRDCNFWFTDVIAADKRKVDDGCSSSYEYKCPRCGRWIAG